MTPPSPKVVPPRKLPPPPPPPVENDDEATELARQREDLERKRRGRSSLIIDRPAASTGLGVPGERPGLRI